MNQYETTTKNRVDDIHIALYTRQQLILEYMERGASLCNSRKEKKDFLDKCQKELINNFMYFE